jgi:hypothetical protein
MAKPTKQIRHTNNRHTKKEENKMKTKIFMAIKYFFEPFIIGWAKLDDYERYMMITIGVLSIFLFCSIILNFASEITLGIVLGTFFGAALYFNKLQTSRKNSREKQ